MAAKKTVTKADLVDQVAQATGLKKKDVKAKGQLTGFGTC